jgi:hypothetical protein
MGFVAHRRARFDRDGLDTGAPHGALVALKRRFLRQDTGEPI